MGATASRLTYPPFRKTSWNSIFYVLPRRAFSKATTRTHVETPMPAVAAAASSSFRSAWVVSTCMGTLRRSSCATGGRPIRGASSTGGGCLVVDFFIGLAMYLMCT